MEARHFEPLLTDVAKHFGRPQDILADERFTRQQKLKLLEQWDYDLQLLMTASEENMPSGDDTSSGRTSEQVTELRQVLIELGAPHDPEAVGPGKVGTPVVEKHRRDAS
ncbi:MAG TPA: hypothetical protein VN229_13660 [Terriglobales bacterium]|nr:hypothetical protein [Terriglobales bacterium]